MNWNNVHPIPSPPRFPRLSQGLITFLNDLAAVPVCFSTFSNTDSACPDTVCNAQGFASTVVCSDGFSPIAWPFATASAGNVAGFLFCYRTTTAPAYTLKYKQKNPLSVFCVLLIHPNWDRKMLAACARTYTHKVMLCTPEAIKRECDGRKTTIIYTSFDFGNHLKWEHFAPLSNQTMPKHMKNRQMFTATADPTFGK